MQCRLRHRWSTGCLALLLAAVAAPQCVPWTNQDVIRLVRSGLSAGVVSARLRSVPCVRFDLSVASLQTMQKLGMPPSVLIAMIEAQKHQDEDAGSRPSRITTDPSPDEDPPWTPAQIDRAGRRALLSVEAWDEKGTRLFSGHGFWVSPEGLILSFGAVDARAHSLRIRSAEGDIYDQVAVVDTDQRRNLSILRVNASGMPALTIDRKLRPAAGLPVLIPDAASGAAHLLTGVTEAPVDADLVAGAGSGYHLLPIHVDGSPSAPIAGRPVLNDKGDLVGTLTPWLWRGELVALPVTEMRGLLRDRLGRMLASAWPSSASAPAAAPPPTDPVQRMRLARFVFVLDRSRSGLDARADDELRKVPHWRVVRAPEQADLCLDITTSGTGMRRSETLEVFDRFSRVLLWTRTARVLPMRRSAIRRLVDRLVDTIAPRP